MDDFIYATPMVRTGSSVPDAGSALFLLVPTLLVLGVLQRRHARR